MNSAPPAATSTHVIGAEAEAGTRPERRHHEADDRTSDRRRALEPDEPERHHPAAHLRRRPQLQGRVPGRHEGDVGGAGRTSSASSATPIVGATVATARVTPSAAEAKTSRMLPIFPRVATTSPPTTAPMPIADDHRAVAARPGMQPAAGEIGQRHLKLVGEAADDRHHHERHARVPASRRRSAVRRAAGRGCAAPA